MALTKDYPNTNWATAVETTVVPRLLYPFAGYGDTSGYIVERDYVQQRSSFTASTLGTTDATYTTAYLIEEVGPTEAGESLVSFTKRWGTVPSDFTVYSSEIISFLGFYETSDETDFRPQQSLFAPIKSYRTFKYTATPDDFTVVGTKLTITKATDDLTIVEYVDDNTDVDKSTYDGYVSGSTEIQISPVSITRAYGVGNVWMQTQRKTVAQ